MFAITISEDANTSVRPIRVEIFWPKGKAVTMELGTARVFEPLLFSGRDDRSLDTYTSVTMKDISWSVTPEGIIELDQYGRA